MGEMVEFPANGGTAPGYLATGEGPGVVVIQEWWGLVPHIIDVADRLAAEGFTALAPDLFRGRSAGNHEPDEAGKLMMALNIEQAAKDLSGAVDLLIERTGRPSVGVIGFCMGGGLALVLVARRPDAVKACATFYGVIPWPSAEPDYSALSAKVVGHYGERDASASPDAARALQQRLTDLGKDMTVHIYPGADHACFNDTRPEVYDADAARLAWERSLELFRATL